MKQWTAVVYVYQMGSFKPKFKSKSINSIQVVIEQPFISNKS